jgi:hypothetical protein
MNVRVATANSNTSGIEAMVYPAIKRLDPRRRRCLEPCNHQRVRFSADQCGSERARVTATLIVRCSPDAAPL